MINKEKFIQRLQKIIDFYGLSASSFADKIDVQRSSISHILSGRNKPSLEFVMKVLTAFPNIDLYWLLNGTGNFPSQKDGNLKANEINTTPIPQQEEIDRIVIFFKDGSFKSFKE